MNKILILGPQGSGKGTQANILAEKLGIPALSMGALLREEGASGSELGNVIADYQARGELVPDDIALNVLKKRLEKEDAHKGYILDGYPRNMEQYETYKAFDHPTALLLITVPHDVSVERTKKRGALEGRNDDTTEIINRRLDIYEHETRPVIAAYEQAGTTVYRIDGMGSIEEIAERIDNVIS